MESVDQEILTNLLRVLENASEPVKQYLSGYAKGVQDATKKSA